MLWYYILIIILASLLCLAAFKRWVDGPVNSFKPNLDNKVVIITGANTGIGLTAALEMAKLKPRILILGCRDPKRGEDAKNKIIEESGIAQENIRLMALDLANLETVKTFSKTVIDEYDKVDILLNNAGTFGLPERTTTEQGHEFTLGVNHLGHFLLTQNLMPLLKKSEEGRVVNVASDAYKPQLLDTSDMQLEKNYNSFAAYSNSKLMNVYFTQALAAKLEKEGTSNVTTYAVHPGGVRTEVFRHNLKNPCFKWCCLSICCPCIFLCMKSPLQGAQTSLFCCLADQYWLKSGGYYANCS